MNQEQTALAVGVSARTLRNWKTAPAFQRERERQHKRAARQPTSAPSRNAKVPARRDPEDKRRDRPPAPATQQETTVEAGARPPSGFRRVDGVPLWGDSDGWPRTAEEHAARDASTPLAATDPRPTATTTTPSSASAARPRPRNAPFAASKPDTETAPAKRRTAHDS